MQLAVTIHNAEANNRDAENEGAFFCREDLRLRLRQMLMLLSLRHCLAWCKMEVKCGRKVQEKKKLVDDDLTTVM